MNLLSINIRGVGGKSKADEIRKLKKDNMISFIDIQETQVSGVSENVVRRFWDQSGMEISVVDADGRSGGLISIWNPGVFKKELEIKNKHYILLGGKLEGMDEKFFICNLYAPNDAAKRKSLWGEIVELRNQLEGLILVTRDFNEVE